MCTNASGEHESNTEERFRDLLKSCLQERLLKLDELFEKLPIYIELSTEENGFYKELENSVSEDLKPVLIKYSDVFNRILIEQQEFCYVQGIKDCFELIHFIREA